MLGKLLKYELKATSRVFLLLYPAIILLAFVNKIMGSILKHSSSNFALLPQGIFGMLYFILIVAVCVVTLVLIIQRFYKNLVGSEGYLMFTIPVSSTSLILSKLITAIIWAVASVSTIIASIFILVYYDGIFADISNGMSVVIQALNEYDMPAAGIIAYAVAFMVISLLFSILTVYTSISIGQLSTKNKLLTSIGAFFGISVLNQVLGTIVMIITVRILSLSESVVQTVESSSAGTPEEMLTIGKVIYGMVASMSIAMLVYISVMTVAMFFVSRYLLSKKLNLE